MGLSRGKKKDEINVNQRFAETAQLNTSLCFVSFFLLVHVMVGVGAADSGCFFFPFRFFLSTPFPPNSLTLFLPVSLTGVVLVVFVAPGKGKEREGKGRDRRCNVSVGAASSAVHGFLGPLQKCLFVPIVSSSSSFSSCVPAHPLTDGLKPTSPSTKIIRLLFDSQKGDCYMMRGGKRPLCRGMHTRCFSLFLSLSSRGRARTHAWVP